MCFAPKEHGVKKLQEWIMKSEPKAREQLQSMSSLTIDQSTLVDTTFSRTTDVSIESRMNLFPFSNKLSFFRQQIWMIQQ